MTRSEFYAKYGSVEVVFSSYYKYTFTYKATLPDGSVLTCGYGGDSGSIYRHSVEAHNKETVATLLPYMGSIYLNGQEVEGFYDF